MVEATGGDWAAFGGGADCVGVSDGVKQKERAVVALSVGKGKRRAISSPFAKLVWL